ncbi:MAG TPA: DUF1877 family protein [Phytomonospora sp.]
MGISVYLQPVHEATPAGEQVDIDTSWFDLAEGLGGLGLDGEFIVLGSISDASEDDGAGDGGVCEGWLDPEEVQANWDRLRAVAFERYLAAYRKTPLGKDRGDPGLDDYLRAHFTTLKDVYRTAAAAGAGLRITAW